MQRNQVCKGFKGIHAEVREREKGPYSQKLGGKEENILFSHHICNFQASLCPLTKQRMQLVSLVAAFCRHLQQSSGKITHIYLKTEGKLLALIKVQVRNIL